MQSKFKIFICSLMACLTLFVNFAALAATAPFAPPAPWVGYSASSTNAATASPLWAVISANSANGGAPVITDIQGHTDKAGGVVTFYRVTAQAGVQYTNSTVTLFVSQTNGFDVSSGVVVIRHKADDTYERRVLTASGQSASTNLALTAAPYTTTVPGDIVYFVTATGAGKMMMSTNVNSGIANSNFIAQAGQALYVGQAGFPLLVELDSTTVGELKLVTAKYVRELQ